MTRFEIALLWVAGLWAFAVLGLNSILYRLGFYYFWDVGSDSPAHAILLFWIPLALIAITRRFWR